MKIAILPGLFPFLLALQSWGCDRGLATSFPLDASVLKNQEDAAVFPADGNNPQTQEARLNEDARFPQPPTDVLTALPADAKTPAADPRLLEDAKVVKADSGGHEASSPAPLDTRPGDVPSNPNPPDTSGSGISWVVDNTTSIGGFSVTASGSPTLTEAPMGKAICFNGKTDQLIVSSNPLAALTYFTVEVLFRPDGSGPAEQRMVHMQADGPKPDRGMIETRVANQSWHLDTYLQSGEQNKTLIDPTDVHPTDAWYWAAMSYDGATMRHFVNGAEEASGPLIFAPIGKGKTSLGMRLNKTSPFKGCIRELRIHSEVIAASNLQRIKP